MRQRQSPIGFPLQDRHRAVAELDALIDQAERACADYRGQLERAAEAGKGNRVISGRLKMASEQLARLRRSRQVLVEGDEGRG